MNPKLLERRETLLRHMVKGVSLQKAAEDMTEDIADPTEREKQVWVIRKDWNNREKWMDNVVRLRDGTFLTELVAGIDEALYRSWQEYAEHKKSGRNPNARIGALRTIVMGKTRLGLLLMKAGVIQQAPQQIESTMTIAGTPFDADPSMKQAILEEAERQRRERENVTARETSPRKE